MEAIKQITKELLEKLGAEVSSIEIEENGGAWKISITSIDEVSLIGRDSERFDALSHLLKRMLAKTLGEDTKIVIDVNDIRKKKEDEIKIKATIIADRARAFKTNVEMDGMTSYERMVVHSHLEGAPNIKTESVGEGRNRRLVIKFIE